jgi:PhnB protein
MSAITLNPYLFFRGNCREAMEYYKKVFGGELTLQTVGESGFDDNMGMKDSDIMHARLDGDVNLMASDTTKASEKMAKVSLSLMGSDEERMRKIFEDLSEGGNVFQKLDKMPWGDIYGQLTDQFGIDWSVDITPAK